MATIEDATGGLNEERLADLEMQWGVALPSAFRQFLLTHNGGYPVPDAFTLVGSEDGSSVHRFLGVEVGSHSNLENYMKTYESRIPNDLFPIAHDPGGNLVCIGTGGSNMGRIFFWDHETEMDQGPPNYSNVSAIADSFDDFLDGLYEVNLD
ncbi:SMI1/KNR4 family protein [Rubinisphaera italica]|uniref:SMI1 / KNR4 family protein n=1 Tax=Rubinisphaera italica TaxID=2527969 RepID=A0A5C5XGE8_9PLAN|nr:SMI1/KNR4 family protein [Rubinisphaera italica]TWT62127.1 SMI1 / KNR4 family protein [Rubinisphaera italica]